MDRTHLGRARRAWRVLAGLSLVVGVAGVTELARGSAADAQATIPPGPQPVAPNPPMADSCGTDAVLVLDASGSIDSAHAVDDVRDAGEAFLDALADTGSTARVLQFGSISEELAPQTEVTAASLQTGGVFRTAIQRYYNPIPPRPPGVSIYSYDGSGSAQSSANWRSANTSNQYTNWDQSLDQAGTEPAGTEPTELVVYVTDGDPTAYDFNQTGDPFLKAPPPNVGVNTNRGDADATTMDRAMQEANEIKSSNTRILVVGVGAAVTGNAASIDRLTRIAGPQVITSTAGVTSINQVDVALISNFADLARFLRAVVSQLCSPSLSIRKLAQSAGNADYRPAPDWDITVTPTVAGGVYEWILPDSEPAQAALCGNPPAPVPGPRTCSTNSSGLATFQWEPDPSTAASSAVVSEAVEPGFTAGRPTGNDYTCTIKDIDGIQSFVTGDFADPLAPTFGLPVSAQDIITCNLYNSFDYAPSIEVTKVDAPTSVRGDLVPPAVVTSSFVVTSTTGNTPLAEVTVVDDRCDDVLPVLAGAFNVGDIDQDRRLDPGLLPPAGTGEAWQFTCAQSIVTPRSVANGGRTITNTAVASGVDPTGTLVESAPASADVTVWNPAISLTKVVDGQPSITVVPPASVTYTYRVTNTGNTPLGTVDLVDDTPPCQSPTPTPAPAPTVLLPGASIDYTCNAPAVTTAVTNEATVTAVPLDPLSTNPPLAPFPSTIPGDPSPNRNPPVTATDTAQVQVVVPGISLTKAADPAVVLLNAAGDPEPVTYTFVATNTGAAALVRDGAAASAPGWVVDPNCLSDAVYVPPLIGPDPLADDRLDPLESATFTCDAEVDRVTVNRASITAQPVDGAGLPIGVPLTDVAFAVVEVARPGISVTKTALRPVVLDESSTPLPGSPDSPVRPAAYVFEVVNTGNVPLVVDPNPPTDTICGPLQYLSGDLGAPSNGLLDVDEIWRYECSDTLSRSQSNVYPVPPGSAISGLVQNVVTVIGIPWFDNAAVPSKTVTDSADASVTVIEPRIELTKTASSEVVLAGGLVTYTIEVHNAGDVGLTVVGPEDAKCAPLVYVSGDNGNGILEGANSNAPETWTYTCSRTLDVPIPPQTADTNTATVIGVDPLGNRFGALDTVTVRVFDPAIHLDKTPRQTLVPAGTAVTYDFDVTNTGTSPLAADDVLAQIELVDVAVPAAPSCRTPAYVSGDIDGDGLLQRIDPPAAAEVWHYECTTPIQDTTTNAAVVRGVAGTQFVPPGPTATVFDFAEARVRVFTPAISVVKSATPTTLALGGGSVTYTYLVRNTGDVPLAGVASRITDDRCSPVTYVSGDLDNDGLLDTPTSIFEDAADEVWIFGCTTTVTTTTTNTVVVTGSPSDPDAVPLCGPVVVARLLPRASAPCDVSTTDDAVVTVPLAGSITVVKRTDVASTDSFSFTFGLTAFTLRNGESRTFVGLAAGTYSVTEFVPDGWQLARATCDDGSAPAAISLSDGESVTCTFENATSNVQPPAPPTTNPGGGTLPSTGSGGGQLLSVGVVLLLAGAAAVGVARRRPDPIHRRPDRAGTVRP